MKLRLQKYLSEQGICSRRKAEIAIDEGRISVNGKTALLGDKIDPEHDTLYMDDECVPHQVHPPLILLLHKPKGFICSHQSQNKNPTIYELLPSSFAQKRWLCAGRLDKESEGLVLLSNSGQIIHRLSHPSNKILKHYIATLNRSFHPDDIPKALEGIEDAGEHLRFTTLTPLGDKTRLDITLNQGRKGEIRRVLEALNYKTLRLQRYRIGPISLGKLPKGHIRELSLQASHELLAYPHKSVS